MSFLRKGVSQKLLAMLTCAGLGGCVVCSLIGAGDLPPSPPLQHSHWEGEWLSIRALVTLLSGIPTFTDLEIPLCLSWGVCFSPWRVQGRWLVRLVPGLSLGE